MTEHALTDRDAVFPGVYRPGAKNQARKIELEFMPVVRRVGTFDLAQLASVAEVDNAFLFSRGQRPNIAVVAIDRVEQRRKRRAKIEAQAASMTDVEDALDFLVQPGAVPILRLGRIIREAVSRPRLDSLSHQLPCLVPAIRKGFSFIWFPFPLWEGVRG